MKTLTIGSTTLELNGFSKRWDKIGGVYAQIEIPTTAISHDDLKVLFTNNQHDLIVTAEDGSTETFSGYAELNEIKESISTGVYVLIQYCTSTAMHLLNEARKQIETLEYEKTELQSKVNTQETEINFLNTQLLMVQMAAADLYEKSLMKEEAADESMGETTMEDAEDEAYLTDEVEPEESEVQ